MMRAAAGSAGRRGDQRKGTNTALPTEIRYRRYTYVNDLLTSK